MAIISLGLFSALGFGNSTSHVTPHLLCRNDNGNGDYLNMPVRTRVEKLAQDKLPIIKYAEIYDHKKHQWVEIPKDILSGLVGKGITDEYLKKFVEKGADLKRVLVLSKYYQWHPMKLEGNALWDKILTILDLPELNNFNPYTMLKCEITEPSNPNVLVLGAVSDHNDALKPNNGRIFRFYQVLKKAYNICYKYVVFKKRILQFN